jgi:hypothetical protein
MAAKGFFEYDPDFDDDDCKLADFLFLDSLLDEEDYVEEQEYDVEDAEDDDWDEYDEDE